MEDVSTKILWVGHEFNGPVNGLAEHRGEKVWFNKLDDDSFGLYSIAPDILEKIEADHVEYCKTTGNPLFHGDEITIIRRAEEKTNIANVKVYIHDYQGAEIIGDYITTVKSCDISNFIVPRRIKC